MGLFNSVVLDWAIGIVFVYLLLAIICTSLNEWIAGLTSARAKTLAQGIAQLLDQQKGSDSARSFLEEFYAHPLISGMMTPGKPASQGHPSYLPSRTFATVVMDLATEGIEGTIKFTDLEDRVKTKMPDGDVRRALLALLQNTNGDLDRAQKNIEQWFDDSMERVSGWYKRRTQVVTIFVAALLTIGTNADTVRIGQILWTDGTLRSAIVENAKKHVETSPPAATVEYPDKNKPLKPVATLKDELANVKRQLGGSRLLGWSGLDLSDWTAWLLRILGWLLSIAAISLGAPFWFGLLSKLVNIRDTGDKPAKSSNGAGATSAAVAGGRA